jgi:hypothetical protein
MVQAFKVVAVQVSNAWPAAMQALSTHMLMKQNKNTQNRAHPVHVHSAASMVRLLLVTSGLLTIAAASASLQLMGGKLMYDCKTWACSIPNTYHRDQKTWLYTRGRGTGGTGMC